MSPARRNRAPAATGTIAAAGTVGITLPPAVMLFFLAGKFGVPIGTMFMSTVVPGAILVMLYALHAVVRAWIEQPSAPAGSLGDDPVGALAWALLILRGLLMPVALIALVLTAVMAGWSTPSQAGAVGAAGGLLLIALNGRLNWSLFRELVRATADLTAMVFFIIIGAGVFSFAFRYFGGDTAIADALAKLQIGPWPTLLLFVGIVFVLGFFIDWIEITVITLPLFTPVLQHLDFGEHVVAGTSTMAWMAAITALVLQTSFLTPPFGFALFFLKGSAPREVSLGQIYRGIVPILLLQLLVIGLVLAMPDIVAWLPTRVYGPLSH
ncbi:MAG: TRAP transporter large permease subunit [Burkholderiaceae bacterium]|nr:TRAP transporter large permease subunit [Burkholderiaceae bacterium]